MCQHLVQRRIDGHKWCRNCGALKVETGDWEMPINPREPNAILEQQRTQLQLLVKQLDAVLPLSKGAVNGAAFKCADCGLVSLLPIQGECPQHYTKGVNEPSSAE